MSEFAASHFRSSSHHEFADRIHIGCFQLGFGDSDIDIIIRSDDLLELQFEFGNSKLVYLEIGSFHSHCLDIILGIWE